MKKERPILFSAPMILAILAGQKTQTRRVFKAKNGGLWPNKNDLPGMNQLLRKCPYGQPGDRLWVRETCRAEELASGLDGVHYMADGAFREIENTPAAADQWLDLNAYRGQQGAQVPSIHMLRWASRILLEIVSVRVERLHECSEADAVAEGCAGGHGSIPGYPYNAMAVEHYTWLWEKINGAGSWAANPWVWVVEFKRVEGQL